MGMYPSATLYYGIYLGCPDEDEMPDWAESEDPQEALDQLLKDIKGVSHDTYGHYDYPRYVLCTRSIHARAYDDVTVEPQKWHTSEEETEALKGAWTALGMQGDRPDPRWFLTTSYG